MRNILRELESCEVHSHLFEPGGGSSRRAFRVTDSQILLSSLPERIHSVCTKTPNPGRLIRSIPLLIPLAYTDSYASYIEIRNNIIAFYPKRQMVCKMWRSSGNRTRETLVAEVRAIQAASDVTCFRVPEVILDLTDTGTAHTPSVWFRQLVDCRTVTSPKVRKPVARIFMEAMIKWYQMHGVEYVEAAALCSDDLNREKLHGFGWSYEEAELIADAFNKVSLCKKCLPRAWIHGDAGLSNVMLNPRDELVILDWELSRRDFLAYDMDKISHQGDLDLAETDALLRQALYDRNRDVLDLNLQVKFIRVLQSANISERRAALWTTVPLPQAKHRYALIRHRCLDAARGIIQVL